MNGTRKLLPVAGESEDALFTARGVCGCQREGDPMWGSSTAPGATVMLINVRQLLPGPACRAVSSASDPGAGAGGAPTGVQPGARLSAARVCHR
ncbi:hypothetical protein NDU88_007241 [Pleurodeles waltl]|uniref:Uncharacterized protein n=1 Tax=Pleurodeles waltl TaxID=8319 RepID=A0AAV7N3R2_PLEWA|nr:hypothetical protein NDU88_007241 [Pleurodeles waltl]